MLEPLAAHQARLGQPSPAAGGRGSAPSRGCHREEHRNDPGLQLCSLASAFMAGGGERADVSVLGAGTPPPPPPVPC